MAAIDKIYATKEQRDSFYEWCQVNCPQALPFFYEWQWEDDGVYPITNFPEHIDMWLLAHCPLEFVQARLQYQYEL